MLAEKVFARKAGVSGGGLARVDGLLAPGHISRWSDRD